MSVFTPPLPPVSLVCCCGNFWLWLLSVRLPVAGWGTCSAPWLPGGGIDWGWGGEALLPWLTLQVTQLCLLIVCVVTSSPPAEAGAVEVVKADYPSWKNCFQRARVSGLT